MLAEMKWHFSRKRPSDKTRDPIASEFFASDAIKDAGEALVREGIQNSLDARIDKGGVCRVRIYVAADQGPIDQQKYERWFRSGLTHYLAKKNGLKPGAVSPDQKCKYLVFEDFETTGLTGNAEQHDPIDGQKNAFFYFFRAEGKTEKGGDDRGRWGVGKQVFPRSSRAQTFFGYSETSEGPLLMGGCILKHHYDAERVCYKPDGYFGISKEIDGDSLTVPIRDPGVIELFKTDFRLSRKPGETGLSIVVPWLDDGDDEDRGSQGFDRDSLAIAAVRGYFIPIIEGRLEVVVEDHVGSHKITRETYRRVLAQIESSGTDRVKAEVGKFSQYLEVAEFAHRGEIREHVLPACDTMKAEWTATMLADAEAQDLRQSLAAGHTVQVKAFLTVRPKDAPPLQDSLVCLIKKRESFSEIPCHVREDLIISDVTRREVKGFICLVRVNRGPLATLLGDSENPSHTEWQKDSKNFKGKYVYGGVAIEFVSRFAHELVGRIHATSRQLDRKLLINLFYDDSLDQIEPSPKKKPNSPQVKEDPEIPAGLPASSLRISANRDGFSVTPSGTPYAIGSRICLQVAYETSKGNPIKAYKRLDFDVGSKLIHIEATGCTILSAADNNIEIDVIDPVFNLRVAGFDVNRDLLVRTKVQKFASAAEDKIEEVE